MFYVFLFRNFSVATQGQVGGHDVALTLGVTLSSDTDHTPALTNYCPIRYESDGIGSTTDGISYC